MTYLKSSIQKTHFLSTAFGSMLGYRRKKRNDVMMEMVHVMNYTTFSI